MSYGVGLRNGVAFSLGTISSLTLGGGPRPSLVLNFLSGTLDPRITFSRATVGTYYDSSGILQTAAINEPRFDYNPVTLAARGLLIEEQRTNLLLQSNDFATTWTPISVSIEQNSTLSPDGTVNADTVAATATAVGSRIQQNVVVSTTSQYVYSCYVRPGTVNTVSLSLYNNTTATALATVNFNVLTGVVVTTTVGSGTITPEANGWYRCVVTHSGTVTATNSIRAYVYPNNTSCTTGDSVIVYGAQLEAGAFPTSYIPTTVIAAPRNADSASITTLTPWYNTVAGTWYAAFQTTWDGNANQSRAVIIGENASKRYLYIGSGQSLITSFDGVSILSPASGDVTGTSAKVASTYNATARTITNNAVAVASGTIAAGYSTPNLIQIGNISSGNYLCGWVSAVRYYPTALPNASLQSITA
jgi:hypothetical protein